MQSSDDRGNAVGKVDLVVDGNLAVAVLSGEIDVASTGEVLHIAGGALTDRRVDALVLDLSQVTFLDSTGLGTIIQLRKQALTAGKQLTLRGVTPAVTKVFTLTGLDKAFGL